ncbi:MAG: two-component system LytT family sensor kinase [Flavobacteriales bacterium]|jgi:two-component system LytT family sensor kinase
MRSNDTRMNWLSQAIFWFLFALIPFIGRALWYGDVKLIYILHTFYQAAFGLLLSILLGGFYTRIWNAKLPIRMLSVILSAALTNFIWTIFRIASFEWLTGESGIWADFGGWFFGEFYLFLCWAALFHGLKYYRLLEIEHEERIKEAALAKEEQRKRFKAEAIAQDARLKMLRYQINPHFLFNCLNSIYALIRLDQSKQAMQVVRKLGLFLRSSLDFNPDQSSDLKQEMSILSLYLDIEKTRFPDRLRINIAIDEDAEQAKTPSLLLQPLIENSIKYAVATAEEGGTIGINACVDGEYLQLEIIDDGPGMTLIEGQPILGRGVGLRNTIERLHVLYGKTGSINFYSNGEKGLRIKIRIPYEIDSNKPEITNENN